MLVRNVKTEAPRYGVDAPVDVRVLHARGSLFKHDMATLASSWSGIVSIISQYLVFAAPTAGPFLIQAALLKQPPVISP